ncbi:hypothetical protein R1T16_16805 [Flavobacterium sp. DG1-102-2]|uniref:hypothetical protein n=1 Tax=Flavobacterium sp. DG1-102-2 TaxID=3081663 RepID=UPI002948F201|nr:hypothetical protein [Flavobacterium sp. DG1-102-2]MDV6170101.1 hypothetical protein [Flavobacterium sp. DG1-102-2]
MKNKHLTFFCILVNVLIMSAQEKSEDIDQDNPIFKIVKENKERSSKIGTFEMTKEKVSVHIDDSLIKPKVKIKKCTFEIDNGFVKDISVETEGGDNFSNSIAISLIRFRSRYNDRLYNENPNKKSQFIKLGDVLKYTCEMGNNFTPDNIKISLPEKKQVKLTERNIIVDSGDGTQRLKKESLVGLNVFKDTLIYNSDISLDDGISNLIDYRVYSDFLGLIESTTNGIVNFEAKICIPVNPTNFSGTNFYIFRSISPHVRYSRFDKEDRAIDIDSLLLPSYVVNNKIQLIQKSFVSCGVAVSVLNWNPKHSFLEFNIPFTTQFYLAEAIPGIEENITSVSYGTGLELKITRSKNFGVNIGSYVNKLRHLYNRKYMIEKIEPFNFFNACAEVFFYGGKKTDALFLRFNYTSVFGDSNNFFQFQIGYKSGLNL